VVAVLVVALGTVVWWLRGDAPDYSGANLAKAVVSTEQLNANTTLTDVRCPDVQKVKKDSFTSCSATLAGMSITVHVIWTDDKGHFTLQIIN